MGGGPESPAAAVAPGRPSSTTVEPAGAAPVGRFAPSPTGRMHLGNVYAALLAWLSVRSRGGRVLMRIEDLDPRAMSGPWAPLILDDLNWLGLTWDGDPVYQHDRLGLYEDAERHFSAAGRALLATTCGDFLIRRSDGVFAYQLAVVVDDAAMGVTEVVRGHDLMGSVPRQLYLQHLLGLPHPVYAHVPLLLAPDGRRLSKRDQDLDIGELRARFGDAAHLLGWLAALTGLSEDASPITAEQLAASFDWERVRRHRADVVISR